MELLRASLQHLHRTAIVVGDRSYRYVDVLSLALVTARQLDIAAQPPPAPSASAGTGSSSAAAASSHGPRVALMCDPGAGYAAGTYAAWLHRGIAVPLCLSHPDRQLQYVLEDAQVSYVLATERHAERLYGLAKPFGAQVHVVGEQVQQQGDELPAQQQQQQQQLQQQQQMQQMQAEVEERLAGQQAEDGALIVYTSGTTGRPKGALHTHASLAAMTATLCAAWEWQPQDRILHALPLHHVHGIVNALYCPLQTGACVEMLPKFSPQEVWRRLQREDDAVSVFMGVPTMYSHLLSRYDDMAPAQQAAAAAAARKLRLTVSGSAACPTPIMARWEQISGQKLLERYGMTETGMLLGNPYRGKRRPGTVGRPFPGVEVRITHPDGSDAGAGPGELRVKSPQLFKEYWQRPDATAEAFDDQGYFLTGDAAVAEEGYFKLLGRNSVDIIKHGGYKISALAIESVLLEHPAIAEVAVVGLPDETYGERIAAVVALKPSSQQLPAADSHNAASSAIGSSSSETTSSRSGLTLAELRAWAAQHLPAYQLPDELKIVEAIPRNAMGKVNKKELRLQLFGADAAAAA